MAFSNVFKISNIALSDLVFAQETQPGGDDGSSDKDWRKILKEEKEKRKSQIDKYTYARAVDKVIKTLGFQNILSDFTRRDLYSLDDVIEVPLIQKSYILRLRYGNKENWPNSFMTIGVKKKEYLKPTDYLLEGQAYGDPRLVTTESAYLLERPSPYKECEFNEMVKIEDIEIGTEGQAEEWVKTFIELTHRNRSRRKILFLDSTDDIKIYLSAINSIDFLRREEDEKSVRLWTRVSISHISENEIFKDWKKYKLKEPLSREIDKYEQIVHPPKVEKTFLGNYDVTLFTWQGGWLEKWEFTVNTNGTLKWEKNIFAEDLY